MKARVYKVALFFIISVLGWPALAQQRNQPNSGYRLLLPSSEGPAKSPLVREKQESIPLEAADEPAIVLHAYATPIEEEVKPIYRLAPKQLWHKAVALSQRSLVQHQRFLETGHPMVIDQDGVYFWRDLYSYTKGVMLASFFDSKMDVGLYERRYTSSETYLTGRPVFDLGAERPGEGYIFSGGRQVFVGVRLDLGKLFKKR